MEYDEKMSHPLAWPSGWKRERIQTRARYRVTFTEARSHLLDQVRLLGGSNPVISSNVPVRRDGLPYAGGYREPKDTGVAIYWTKRGRTHVMACDRWTKVIDNIRGLGLALEALRAIERSGASEILERAFSGFAALPVPEGSRRARPWWEVLGFDEDVVPSRASIERAYRERARTHHPDRGGDHDAMVELNLAREQGLREAMSHV